MEWLVRDGNQEGFKRGQMLKNIYKATIFLLLIMFFLFLFKTKQDVSLNRNSLSLGLSHSCATIDGELFCWGDNSYGQLGHSLTEGTSFPVIIVEEEREGWEIVSTGNNHSCGITGGDLFCWGQNNYGQIGDGTKNTRVEPVYISSEIEKAWEDISLGAFHSCGISGKEIYCWGSNKYGQLGNGASGFDCKYSDGKPGICSDSKKPVRIGEDFKWKKLSAGGYYTCGIEKKGSLYCWGAVPSLSNKRLYHSPQEYFDKPVKLDESKIWDSISIGSRHLCGISGGMLFCFGANDRNQINSMPNEYFSDFIKIDESNNWTSISSASCHNCGVNSGEVKCWGCNNNGQLGRGSLSRSSVPEKINSEHKDWIYVATSSTSSCGIRDNKDIYCWGSNSHGQLGNGTMLDSSIPVKVAVLKGDNDNEIAKRVLVDEKCIAEAHECNIKEGRLFCKGRNDWGQLGLGTRVNRCDEKQIGNSVWKTVSTGRFHSCGIKNNGDLYCWGRNLNGQLGDGRVNRYEGYPKRIAEDKKWNKVSAGADHTCGISEGHIYCWGGNEYGQLGDGHHGRLECSHDGTIFACKDVFEPKQVGQKKDWVDVYAGEKYTCGKIKDGKIDCWGEYEQIDESVFPEKTKE